MRRLLTAGVWVATTGLFAQGPVARPRFETFEVAAIKPSDPASKGRWIRMQTAQQFAARNHTVKTLVAAAYNVSPKAISGGPEWVDGERFDILAKTPGGVRPNLEEQMAMLRQFLAERFQLTFHRERKEMSYYALTVAKGGSKLRASATPEDATPEGPPPLVIVLSPDGALLPGRNATMGELASVMQRAAMDRPVVDQTGLTGRFDFDLEWMNDDTQFGGVGPRENPESTRPDLFGALQKQLGLKLDATRGPVDVIVIDRVARPSEN